MDFEGTCPSLFVHINDRIRRTESIGYGDDVVNHVRYLNPTAREEVDFYITDGTWEWIDDCETC